MSSTQVNQIDEVRSCIDAGARLVWIFGEPSDGVVRLHYVIEEAGRISDVIVDAAPKVASLTDLRIGASWYEREVRDRFGVAFDGLHDAQALIVPPIAESIRKTTSPEVSAVLYGPIRSGISESARWLVETAGEDFIDVTPSMFFKHRGVEERFVDAPLTLAPFIAEHASGASASSHAAAFSCAVERALGIDVPDRARAARAILVELERVHQHLDSLAKLADDGSLAVGSAATFAAKERVHRLLVAATGNRFARGTICAGGVRFDVLSGLIAACERDLDTVEREAITTATGLLATQSLLDRLIGAGRLSRETVEAYGGVGPVARGNGIACDVRMHDGNLFTAPATEESLEVNGDAVSRAAVRASEISRSFRSIRDALDAAPPGPYITAVPQGSSGSSIVRVESPQGELAYLVRIEQGRLARVALRSASFANWPLFVPSLPGNIFTDFSFIEHSFGLLQSEVDR